jgi:hypothetical protein
VKNMKKKSVEVSVLIVMLLVLMLMFNVSYAGTTWSIETVDDGGTDNVGKYTSLALTSGGYPRISYYDLTNGDLKYAGWEYTEDPFPHWHWAITTVDSDGDVGDYSSIALDSDGEPHISYYDFTNGDLLYVTRVWITPYIRIWTAPEVVDSTGNVGMYTSLAIDSSDNPHISYYDQSNSALKHASRSSSGVWSTTTVDNTGVVGRYSSIALDSTDNPHISYYDTTNGDLKYAYWRSLPLPPQWITVTVDSTGNVGWDTSLALDSINNPHISYHDDTNGDLKYAYWQDIPGTWIKETVDSVGSVGWYTSLALASGPRISYYDYGNDDLKFAAFYDDGWNLETVDKTGFVGQYSSLALDSTDNPHISYYDTTNGDLKYLSGNTQAPTGSIVINDGDITTISTYVELTLTYTAYGATVDQVRYSNDGVWDTEMWEEETPTKPWTLMSGDGTKTVYYQIKDSDGIYSPTYSDTIILEDDEKYALEDLQFWYWGDDTVINSVARGDVDGDGEVEVVTGGSFNDGVHDVAQLVVWNGATLAFEGVQPWLWGTRTVINSVAVGDVDGDSQAEIVTGGFFNDGIKDVAQLVVWDGASLAVEDVQFWDWGYDTLISSVAVGNVDGDGQAEIVTGGHYSNGAHWCAQLCVWSGAALALENVQPWYWYSWTSLDSVAVGDVDGDGQVEIVTGGDYFDGVRPNAQLCVWSWNGLVMTCEKAEPWLSGVLTDISSVAVADVDLDGQVEIVTGGYYDDGVRDVSQLRVWSWDGVTMTMEDDKYWYWPYDSGVRSVAVGDVDDGGVPEVVTGGHYDDGAHDVAQLSAWDVAGVGVTLEEFKEWSWGDDTSINSVMVGDVDGDGVTEVVTGGYFFDGTRYVAQLCVWRAYP